jgi:hypothetical protein
VKVKTKADEFENEFIDEAKVLVEVKVSDDGGETWKRRKISMISGLEESSLNIGEIFQFNGEKYKVIVGEDGMTAERIKKPERQKSAIEKKPVKRRK